MTKCKALYNMKQLFENSLNSVKIAVGGLIKAVTEEPYTPHTGLCAEAALGRQ